MTNSIPEILKYLDPNDETIQELIDSFRDCHSAARANELIQTIRCKEDEYLPDFRSADKKPFCSILFAVAYSIRGDHEKAFTHLEDAERGFNCSGQERNLAVTRWIYGLLLLENDQPEQAKLEMELAASSVDVLCSQFRRISRYEEAELFQDLSEQIKGATPKTSELKAVRVKPRPEGTKEKYSGNRKPKKTALRTGSLIFPIFSPVSAGKGGDFVFDSLPQGQVAIAELSIDEKPYRVFSMKADEPVVLHPRIHRWLYVQGDSMDQATPYPLAKGDCILVVETGSSGLAAQTNDIVVAALLDPAGEADRAGVVKRYTSKGLCSESTQTYDPIPLKKARIKGIVLAVAKPVNQE